MSLSSLPPAAADAVRSAGDYLNDLLTPTLRLGVTGLSRSGKTVFITALVRSLVTGGRLPFFAAQSQGRIQGAYLEPQPDDAVPRFDYEGHLAALARQPPEWPDSTRAIAELRVTIPYQPQNWLRRQLGLSRLHVDIVDYPGEWLIDLSLMEKSYSTWASEAVALASAADRAASSRPFLDFLRTLDPSAPVDEQVALTGAKLFTAYLESARDQEHALRTLTPGRFLMPGDLAGSPQLTFFPLPCGSDPARNSLAGMLARRYESYKANVVRPFFREHFSRLDRQIVLVDALGALNAGPTALTELQVALQAVLRTFQPGAGSWLDTLLGRRRVDKLLFAATKADHLHHTSHDRLEAALRLITDRAIIRANAAGASVGVMAMAALRATREGVVRQGKEELPVIIGVPMPGERIGRQVFDGVKETAVFPGDLPEDARAAVAQGRPPIGPDDVRFVRFRPPRVSPPGADGEYPAARISGSTEPSNS